ncbi:SdpI family protein [Myxococcus sp. K38C18041901]|uniref:SdpI family protein n=1 Tax=Myxococcus guangdongensis TaxID=2906760 RepID=UPI0020A78B81|nr:SdpI family protein [Myxococcus guangdongensis]MCP3065566.1 SdpI family protein [Myxococcus guangdongensis]
MRISRANAVGLGFVIVSFAMAAVFYERLPDSIPTHWNAKGVADGYTAKPWGPFMQPLVMAGVYLLMRVLPRISPRGYRMERFQSVYEFVVAMLLAFLFLVNGLVLLAGLGVEVPMARALHAGTGLLFMTLGNFMGKVTKNFFFGIRTPWTLANDEVWLRTHRLGGKLFVLAGLALVVTGLMGAGPEWVLVLVGVVVVIPVVYSYVISRRLEGGSTNDEGTPRSL